MPDKEQATGGTVAYQDTIGTTDCNEYGACCACCQAENTAFWPPCLEFYRVRECIFEQFMLLNYLGDQAAFNKFMDGLPEFERLELMDATREVYRDVIEAWTATPPSRSSTKDSRGKRASGTGKRRPASYWRGLMEDGVPAGSRDNTLTSVAGMLLRNPDVPPDQRLPLLRQFNERYCKPPLPDADVRRIAGVFRRYS